MLLISLIGLLCVILGQRTGKWLAAAGRVFHEVHKASEMLALRLALPNTNMYVCMYVRTYVCMYVCMYVCVIDIYI